MAKTYGDQFKEALACESVKEAQEWLALEVKRYWDEFHIAEDKALATIKINIGYMAGYYGDEERRKMERLFGAAHPIFGSTMPTVGEAVRAGTQAGTQAGMNLGGAQ